MSKEFDVCHYWYFKDVGFQYEAYLCNGCHDLMQKAMSFNNIGSAYRINYGIWAKMMQLT